MLNENQLVNFWKKVNKLNNDECWEWNVSCRSNGYGAFKTKNKTHSSHRLSYEIEHGEINNPKLFVCHTCDNRQCVNPDHLFLGTAKDNMQDCKIKGRMVIPEGFKFEKQHTPLNSILSNEKVLEIYNIISNRRNNNESLKLKELSELYNVKYTLIRDISCGRTYINKNLVNSSNN